MVECKCGFPMTIRKGKYGPFLGCTNYPHCKEMKKYTPVKIEAGTIPYTHVPGTSEQQNIWNEIQNGTANVFVNAGPGTGKSFTARAAMHLLPKDATILYLAFNKRIVDEFLPSAPANAHIKTFNSFGHSICQKNLGYVTIDNMKIQKLIVKNDPTKDGNYGLFFAMQSLIELCQNFLIQPQDTAKVMETLAYQGTSLGKMLPEALDLLPVIHKAAMNNLRSITLNEQIYLPIVLNMELPKYDYVFVDEAQDLNKPQIELIARLSN